MQTSPHGEMVDLDVVRSALAAEFDILAELGRGGMAIVYRALERELEREVALKVLPFSLAFDADFVERFQREARTAGRLEHPNIVPIYRVGRSGSVIYFTMQLLRGQSLSDLLRERGRLTVPEIRRILVETASALGYASKHGVVHRDVKPDNILLDVDGRCVVTDFGIARCASDQRLTATGMSVGTPRYMSPEQARTQSLDVRSDLYSLGIVAYECLVGGAPFAGDDAFAILMEHINAPLPRPALDSDDERALFAIIERMLAKSPAHRFQTADELIAALGASVPGAAVGGAMRGAVGGAIAGAGAATTAPRRPLTPTRAAPAVTGWPAPRVRPSSGMDRWRMRLAEARDAVAGRSRKFWALSAGSVALLFGGYQAVHFATMHRSRCAAPVSSVASSLTDGSADPRSAAAAPLVLLVDAIDTRSAGGDLDVYYDVCGLEDGTSFTTRLTVRRAGFTLPGFGSRPITAAYNERADADGSRRHRTLDFDDMPAGSYSLVVDIRDARGRTRERRIPLEVTK